MGKRGLWTGIVLGATVGAIVSLLNEDTRVYVKHTTEKAGDQLSFYAKNPAVGISKVKQGVQQLNETVSKNTAGAMNTLDQVESSLNKFLK